MLLTVTVFLFVGYMLMDDDGEHTESEPEVASSIPHATKSMREKHRKIIAEASLPKPRPAAVASTASVFHAKAASKRHLRGGVEMEVQDLYAARQQEVVAEFMHAFEGYRAVAWGHDEVRPESNITNDSWGGFAVTLIDCLDTMMLMGLVEPLKLARAWIAEHLDFNKDWDASFFEFSIRYLGGLLSAYELSEDRLYLEKAKDIGDRLLRAFDSKIGMPYPIINLKTGKGKTPSWNSGRIVLAEFGSVQLEFKSLAHHLQNRTYFQLADRVMKHIREIPRDRYKINGVETYPLLPVFLDIDTATNPSGHISLGAMADSYYEYLLKQWLQSQKEDKRYRLMYDEFVDRVQALLLKESVPNKYTVIGEFSGGRVTPKMDHLVCFFPGLLALGAEGEKEESHLKLAENLMETCWQLYATQPSGLAPEIATFNVNDGTYRAPSKQKEKHPDYDVMEAKYLLVSPNPNPRSNPNM